MKVITLYEFQPKYLSALHSEGVKVSPEQLKKFFETINALYGRRHEVLSLRYDTKKGEYYIEPHGSVGFAYHLGNPQFMVQVLPKPYKRDRDEKRSLRLFLSLLNLSGGLGMSERDIEEAVASYGEGSNVHELFLYLFISTLTREMFHGLYREYVEVEEDLQTIRGRVLLSRLARRLPTSGTVPVRHAILNHNTPLNRVLKAALKVVSETSEWRGISKSAESLLGYFHGVGALLPGDIARVSFNPLNERFRSAFYLATMILLGFHRVGGGGRIVPGIFIEMDRLFEDLLYHTILSTVAGEGVVRKQQPLPPLIPDSRGLEAKTGAVLTFGPPLPDIVVKIPTGRCVVEAKYRSLYVRMKDRPWKKLVRNSTELYQVYAYSKLLGGGALIVYPRLKGHYNDWIPDIFGSDTPVVHFFDGVPLAIAGYELSRIGRDVVIVKNGVILKGSTLKRVKSLLESVCTNRGAGREYI